jgi:UDP-N-acetylmuramoyl-tripeptide--D-alanyl-D-alanine ligase
MAELFEALEESRRGAWAENSEALQPLLMDALTAGDAVMIKGSLGSRMGLLVEAIKRTFPQVQGTARLAAE